MLRIRFHIFRAVGALGHMYGGQVLMECLLGLANESPLILMRSFAILYCEVGHMSVYQTMAQH
jgi:hypothetical protein